MFFPFHIVDISPWPMLGSLVVMNFFMSSFMMFYELDFYYFVSSIISLLMLMWLWWRDVCRESTFQGAHTMKVVKGIQMGMILFISSEVMFFFAFFFGFFFFALSPDFEIGSCWPPVGIQVLDYYSTPLLNSLILLSSGISITWTHHSLLNNKFFQSVFSLIFTIILGMMFTILQIMEYFECSFSITDSIYGSLFFTATGFHGIHVLVGTIFIMVSMIRMIKGQMNYFHHEKGSVWKNTQLSIVKCRYWLPLDY